MAPLTIPDKLISLMREASRIAVLTGAGISAESGVPTFRDAQSGLWSKFKPEDLATPEAFRRNPQLVWDWYAWRRQQLEKVAPNAGHFALAKMESHCAEFLLITQNVDGLHERAGSKRVVELHGNIMRTKCFDEGSVVESWPETGERPPKCPKCGGALRPDVVWFGEMLPEGAYAGAVAASRRAEVFLSVGTSGVVEPAASLPLEALKGGAYVVEINPQETPLSARASASFRVASGKFLPELVEAVWPGG